MLTHTIPPQVFRFVGRLVGGRQEILHIAEAIMVVGGDADAHGDVVACGQSREVVRVHHSADAARDLHGTVGRDLRQEKHELLSSDARDHVIVAHMFVQDGREL
ncbi:MAG: hypothetical protein VX938_07235, partial [Myxococcota bacterium]|nr:hypothetical protein [Myxococcota bacterium]